jgi:hypothetical protein
LLIAADLDRACGERDRERTVCKKKKKKKKKKKTQTLPTSDVTEVLLVIEE